MYHNDEGCQRSRGFWSAALIALCFAVNVRSLKQESVCSNFKDSAYVEKGACGAYAGKPLSSVSEATPVPETSLSLLQHASFKTKQYESLVGKVSLPTESKLSKRRVKFLSVINPSKKKELASKRKSRQAEKALKRKKKESITKEKRKGKGKSKVKENTKPNKGEDNSEVDGKDNGKAKCPPNGVVPNWQSWAKLDYENSTGCGPEGDHQCYGNGECRCDMCVCDVGWRGPYCSQLDLLPAKRSAPGIAMDGGHPTWGGSAVYDDGKWKLLAGSKIALASHKDLDPYTFWGRKPEYDKDAALKGEDPFHGNHPWKFTVEASKNPFPNGGTEIDSTRNVYQQKSWLSLYESEGSDAAGPYHEKVPKWFRAFRADFKKDPASGALLELSNAGGGFMIIQSKSGSMDGPWTDKDGNPLDEAWAGATAGLEPTATTKMPKPVYKYADNGHCSKSRTGSLAGKYVTKENGAYRECTVEEKDAWNCHVADPSFVVHPNGTTVIMYRGTRCESADGHTDHKERLGLIVADCWHCEYRKGSKPIFKDDEVMNGGLEDLFMWVDKRGTHMVVHSQAQDHAYDVTLPRALFHHKKKRGAYLFSADGKERWSLSDWELFPAEIRWDDGTTQFLLKQQRPSIIFDPQSGKPSHLVTGVDFLFDACCDWFAYGSGWTLVQPISTCSVGYVLDGSRCKACKFNDAAYHGRCAKATSKYGGCVCGVCKDGYSGDNCEIEPEPVYETSCEDFRAGNECADMDGDAKWIGGSPIVEAGTCLSDCQAYAHKEEVEGCCFQFTAPDPSNSNCRFFEGQQMAPTSKSRKAASVCVRVPVDIRPK